MGSFFFLLFFKQKTAYEIMPSLVGSEMCIRDRYCHSGPNFWSSFRRYIRFVVITDVVINDFYCICFVIVNEITRRTKRRRETDEIKIAPKQSKKNKNVCIPAVKLQGLSSRR